MIIQRWDLTCDAVCETWATNLVAATETEARELAGRMGWRRSRDRDLVIDLCPAHASEETGPNRGARRNRRRRR